MYEFVRMHDGIDRNDNTYGYIGHQGDIDMLGWMFCSSTKSVQEAIDSLESEHPIRHNNLRIMSKKRAIRALKQEYKKRF
jgi:hypothetical protein